MLDDGILAEMDGGSSPEMFKAALEQFIMAADGLEEMIGAQNTLLEAEQKFREQPVETFTIALEKILTDMGRMNRASDVDARFAQTGGRVGREAPDLASLTDILEAQLVDLKAVHRKSLASIDALRTAIPLAERSEFVPVMLSGRNAFGDLMPEYTNMLSAFERFYTQTCMATISATMQSYPDGWEFLAR